MTRPASSTLPARRTTGAGLAQGVIETPLGPLTALAGDDGLMGLLLLFWLAPGFKTETAVFGWVHGFTWIGLALLAAYGQRRGAIPFWLAFLVVVIGGVGPFAGSAGFIYEKRRRRRLAPRRLPRRKRDRSSSR